MDTKIDLKKIRVKSEKILFALAVIFSGFVWGGIFYLMIGPIITPVVPIEPCIYEEDGLYNYMSYEEATEYDYECLQKEKIPSEIWKSLYQEGKEELTTDAKKDKWTTFGESMIIVFYFFSFVLFFYIATALAMADIRLNGIKLSEKQYKNFYAIYRKTAEELGIKKIPNAYIIHAAGELNAFAIKIARKRMVVFYAELVETLTEGDKLDELHAVAAHELTHVKLRHIYYWFLLIPFNFFPFFGKMLSRAREYSADRGALAICGDTKIVTQALVKLAAGKFVAKEVDIDEYIQNAHSERGFFIILARLMATHPPIPTRIQALNEFSSQL
ncbi:M48 family metallopeptidase [Candidatus Peregrinibacteria bacterium]|nr:M48 family metallopeptidase [Candidatus Peregrinibacteria bacterium]